MTVDNLIRYFEVWAPPGASWDRDNVGLQVGSGRDKIKNILLCLEFTPEVLKEAVQKNCNLIITHHPLIFNPIKKLNFTKDNKSDLIKEIIRNGINVYSAHTNLDFTKDGVSFELAKTLGLKGIRFLKQQESNQFKIAVFVPEAALEKVSSAVFSAGGGRIGEYENCSFNSGGFGTFKGSENSNPAVGSRMNFEKVPEIKFETIADSWNLNSVVKAIIGSHPYEEPAYDVYPLKNQNVNFGFGAIGEFEKEMPVQKFLTHVTSALGAEGLRYCKGKKTTVKKVAVCGGSGSDLLSDAVSSGADAFVTADIKYHTFQDAENKILMIDAGHYETEIHSMNAVKQRITEFLRQEKIPGIKVYKYKGSTNPVKFFKH